MDLPKIFFFIESLTLFPKLVIFAVKLDFIVVVVELIALRSLPVFFFCYLMYFFHQT